MEMYFIVRGEVSVRDSQDCEVAALSTGSFFGQFARARHPTALQPLCRAPVSSLPLPAVWGEREIGGF